MRTARGFTLIEILVALTLFAVVGGALLQLFQSGLRGARLAGEQAHAALLARSKLTELQAYTGLQPGILAGAFVDGYRWQAVLREGPRHDGPPASLQPLDLELTVTWGEGTEPHSFVLDSLLLTRLDAE
ncbi:MAG: type II secretion system protein [Sedimenticolaceae bacterium]